MEEDIAMVTIQLPEIEDFRENVTVKEDLCTEGKDQRISTTKAVEHFITNYHLLASIKGSIRSNNNIWIYNTKKGIYVPNGTNTIRYIIEEVCGDLCDMHDENEIIHRIVSHRPFDPSQFNPNPYILCLRNGIVDLTTKEFKSHSPKYLITTKLDIEYNQVCTYPIVFKYLNDVVEDPRDVDTILDFWAVCLIQKPFDIFLELIGVGANGKGRLLLFTRWFLGEKNITSQPLDGIKGRFASNGFYGKWLLINGESESGFPIDEIKNITSGNPMHIEIKGGGFFEFVPFLKMLFDTNNPAIIKDTSKGRQRRHYTLDFKKEFVDNPEIGNKRQLKKDKDILEKMCTEEEKSGLLNELIKRAHEIINGRPIYRRKNGKETMDDYDAKTHTLNGFVEECCDINEDVLEKSHFEYFKDILASYEEYCKTLNVPPKTDKTLGLYLTSKGLKSTREGTKRLTVYHGIKILDMYKRKNIQ